MPEIIFFVDIDGTVSLMPEYISNRSAFKAKLYEDIDFDEASINNLNDFQKVCNLTLEKDVGIVISSAWRFNANASTFHRIFANNNCKIPVIDKTPLFSYSDSTLPDDYARNTRGREIERWLDNYKSPVENFVIFDDMTSDIIEIYSDKLVGLDSSKGIDEQAYEQALQIILNEN